MTETHLEVSKLKGSEKRRLLEELLKKQAADHFHPLSYSQRAMWFLHELAPQSSAYNTAFAATVHSPVAASALRQAFQALMHRHAALRTTFAIRDGQLVQQIHASMELHFEQIDASGWSDLDLRGHVEGAYSLAFDLESGPVLRVHLFKCSDSRYVLLVTIHHIVFDGWSFWILLEELGILYNAEHVGGPRNLQNLTASYTDFVNWESQMLTSSEGKQHWAYWQSQLSGILSPLNLPTDRPRPSVQTHNGSVLPFCISEHFTERLKEFASSEGATLFVTLLAAFQILLRCYSGQKDILVGSPTTGRSRAEFTGIVGDFVNMVALRGRVDDAMSFKAYHQQMRQNVLEALSHQEYPFALIVEKLGATRDLSHSPVFQIMFVLHKIQRTGELAVLFDTHKTDSRVNLGGLELQTYPLEQQKGQFDLTLELIESRGQLMGNFKYNTDLFDLPTIDQMAGHFLMLLEEVIDSPNQPLNCLMLFEKARKMNVDHRAEALNLSVDRKKFETMSEDREEIEL